ncbi:uricase-like [Watersipora subatra]|uniref:uricase-like n=1 Tax=Watersipora subatra TaxID=2589382 RepID=UPI00355B6D60
MDKDSVNLISTSYGKTGVKLLYVQRNPDNIIEFEVSTLLQLNDTKDYQHGNNSLVVPTDTQKNLVYITAQRYGVSSPEEFAMKLAGHFLSAYPQIVSARVTVETVHGWKRIDRSGQQHSHAFISSPECTRMGQVFQRRGGPPQVSAGLKGLRVLKTTNSAFKDFHNCDATTLTNTDDRIFSTVVEAQWSYSSLQGLHFCNAWDAVLDCILETFAGPAGEGVFSPSVQLTVYDTEKLALSKVKQISEISMSLPNVHYFDVDMARFTQLSLRNTKNVYLPTDKPSGIIKATLARSQTSKL